MAISDELRKEFNERVRPIKEKINDCLKKKETNLLLLEVRRKELKKRKFFFARK